MLKQFLKIGCVVFGTLTAMNCAGMNGDTADQNIQQLKEKFGSNWIRARAKQIDDLVKGKQQNEEAAKSEVDRIDAALKAFAEGGELPENSGYEDEDIDEYRRYVKQVITGPEGIEFAKQRRHLISQILMLTDKKIGELKKFQTPSANQPIGFEIFNIPDLVCGTIMFHVSESLFKNKDPYLCTYVNVTEALYDLAAAKILRSSSNLSSFPELKERKMFDDIPTYKDNNKDTGLNFLNFLIATNGSEIIKKALGNSHPEISASDINLAILTAWGWLCMSNFDKVIPDSNEFAGHTPLTIAMKKLAIILNHVLKSEPNQDQPNLNEVVPVYLETIKYIADHIDVEENKRSNAFIAKIPNLRIINKSTNTTNDQVSVAEGYVSFIENLIEVWKKGKVSGKVLKQSIELGQYLRTNNLIVANDDIDFVNRLYDIVSTEGWNDTYQAPEAEAK